MKNLHAFNKSTGQYIGVCTGEETQSKTMEIDRSWLYGDDSKAKTNMFFINGLIFEEDVSQEIIKTNVNCWERNLTRVLSDKNNYLKSYL